MAIRQSSLVCVLALVCHLAAAEDLTFSCTTDKPAISYQPGERMVFSIQLLAAAKPVAGRRLAWTRRGDDQKKENGEAVSSDSAPLVIETACDRPGFVHIVVRVLAADGKPEKGANGKEVVWECGAGVEPEKLGGVAEPTDFDAFWARQKARLQEVPVKAVLEPVTAKNPQFDVFDVKIDCPGGKPVSGYLTRPKGAAAKSLTARVGFMGYGIHSANQESYPGIISLAINAHGIENGREPAYYDALKTGALKGYAFDQTQNSDPATAYFNGMALRVLRALEYVKTQPEWNGKDLIAAGGSQGGFQALLAAGLDPQVTSCRAYKPWCCDLGGPTLQRVGGWRPDWTAALGYYDPINHARRIRCDTYLSSGLGDYVCPPSGIAVVYNSLAGPRKLEFTQGATHGFDPPGGTKFALPLK